MHIHIIQVFDLSIHAYNYVNIYLENVEQLYLLNATNNNHCAMKNYFVEFKEMFCNIRGYSLTLHSQHTFKKKTLYVTIHVREKSEAKD